MILKKNVGYLDSIIRAVLGAAIVTIGLYNNNYWGLLGLILVSSGVVSFCPIYYYLGIITGNPNLEREN